MMIPESPELGLKQLKGRLGHFQQQMPQQIETMEERQAAAEEQRENVLRQIFGVAGTSTGAQRPALGHRESL